jgi:hypothetical protein
MPATVIVNFMTVVHKTSNGMVMIFPDVCKTPTPAGPVPIPYPNIAMSVDTANGTKTVKCDGQPIMIKSSYFMQSTGDEAGAAMGVVSNRIKGKAYPKMYSFDVKAEGENVFRLLDIMLMNGASPTNTPPSPELQPPSFALGNSQSPKKRKIKSVKWRKTQACCGDEVKLNVKTENLSGRVISLAIRQQPGKGVAAGRVRMQSENVDFRWIVRRGPYRKTVKLEGKASGYGKAVRSSNKLLVNTVVDVSEEKFSESRTTPKYVQKNIPGKGLIWVKTTTNYGWDVTYGIGIKRGVLRVRKMVKFELKNGAQLTSVRKRAWAREIHRVWDKKWKLHRKKCKRGDSCNCPNDNCCCMFPVRIRCEWGSGHGKKVELHKGANDANGWGSGNWWYSHKWWEGRKNVPKTVRAHEFGHLIGMYDEYPAGACDPARKFTNVPTSIMNVGSTTYSRHMQDFHAWFEKKTKGQIGETLLLRY